MKRAVVWRIGPREWAAESCPATEYRPRPLPISVRVPFSPGRISRHHTHTEALVQALTEVGLATPPEHREAP